TQLPTVVMSHSCQRRLASRSFFVLLVLVSLWTAAPARAEDKKTEKIHWNTWSPALFEQAKREHRFVLLDLEAVWCHWCHVMDENTYANPDVIALVKSNYFAIRVDQD